LARRVKGKEGVQRGLGVFSHYVEASFFTLITRTHTHTHTHTHTILVHFVRILAVALQLTVIDCSGVVTILERYIRCRTVKSEELLVTKEHFQNRWLTSDY